MGLQGIAVLVRVGETSLAVCRLCLCGCPLCLCLSLSPSEALCPYLALYLGPGLGLDDRVHCVAKTARRSHRSPFWTASSHAHARLGGSRFGPSFGSQVSESGSEAYAVCNDSRRCLKPLPRLLAI